MREVIVWGFHESGHMSMCPHYGKHLKREFHQATNRRQGYIRWQIAPKNDISWKVAQKDDSGHLASGDVEVAGHLIEGERPVHPACI